MESKRSTNFDFILKTSIEGYYDLLKNAEKAWETHAVLTYIASRMVVEDLLVKLEEKYGVRSEENKEVNFRKTLNNLKEYIPSWVIESGEYLRIKGDKSANKEIDSNLEDESSTLLALKKVHEILIWYLKNITKEISIDEDYNFITPESLKESECDLAIDKKVLENKKKFIISLEKQIKTNSDDEQKQEELEALLKSVKEEKKDLTEKLEKKEVELQEVLNNFKELQVKLMNYVEKDESIEGSNSKYPDFYKGFLSLQGYELRVVYAFLKSLSLGSIFLNKSRGIFLKSQRKEFIKFIEKEVEELKKYPDNILKLKLYYILLKLTNTPSASVADKPTFDKSLDSIVEKAYFIIEKRDAFNGKVDKLEAIVNYYLIVIINSLSAEINKDEQNKDKISDIIYEVLRTIPLDERKIILNKMNFTDISENTIKENIRLNQVKFLNAALDCGISESSEFVIRSIFSIYVAFQKDFDFYEFRTRHDMLRAYIGPLLLVILLKEFKISREILVPIFVMEISISNKILRKERREKIYYNQLVEAWLEEKEKYDKILSEKNNLEKNLKEVQDERELLITNERKFVAEKDNTENAIKAQWNMFREKVFESEEIKNFDSYEEYSRAVNQKNLIELSEEHSLKDRGFVKNLFSLDTWKYKLNKLEINKNIRLLEDKLIEQAKESGVFENELLTIRELEEILADKESGLEDIRIDLKENTLKSEKLDKLIKNNYKLMESFKEDNFDFAK
ncbi:hypothetical protein [Clostridium sp. LIBA-8841]|uniref:hypothetical protein n=1 Tax=Clostridium sp. LIBA-8841 TaxID=2987530 RepID=UPI002AC3A42A|nr:hypothetical protein [Clostridium sp. LIBA-8841]MDZ5255300.1 hypothetical protein [Clostridium sp. LIBA-8841]